MCTAEVESKRGWDNASTRNLIDICEKVRTSTTDRGHRHTHDIRRNKHTYLSADMGESVRAPSRISAVNPAYTVRTILPSISFTESAPPVTFTHALQVRKKTPRDSNDHILYPSVSFVQRVVDWLLNEVGIYFTDTARPAIFTHALRAG